MNKDNTLSQKEIKEGMSPTPWFCVDYAGYQILQRHDYYDSDEGLLDEDKCPQAPINGHAAITAVNNTYGKNLNPEAFEDAIIMLEKVFKFYEAADIEDKTIIEKILNKARI